MSPPPSPQPGISPTEAPILHPIQCHHRPRMECKLRAEVTLRAYEVYCHVYSPQPALIDLEGRGCRGGFGIGEIVAFLYARSFPKEEWSRRVDEAMKGAVLP